MAKSKKEKARQAISLAIADYITLSASSKRDLETARIADDDAEYEMALKRLMQALPEVLWVSYDSALDEGLVQEAEPIWLDEDPSGEDPKEWQKLTRNFIAFALIG